MGQRRVTWVGYSPDEQLLLLLSADKTAELWAVRDEEYIDKRRRKRRKKLKRQAKEGSEGKEGEGGDEQPTDDAQVDDVFTPLPPLRSEKKIVSASFAPPSLHKRSAANLDVTHRLLLSLADNSLHYFALHLPSLLSSSSSPSTSEDDEPYSTLSTLDLPGHRTPIRTSSLSSDASLLLTASSEAIKIWSITSHSLIRTLPSGHALCSLFVPGNQHVIIGTKDGDIEWFDINSAKCLGKVKAHEGGSVFCMELSKDGRGFASGGGDKQVKVWQFTLEADPTPAEPALPPRPAPRVLSIVLARTLTLTDDILCLRHSPNGLHHSPHTPHIHCLHDASPMCYVRIRTSVELGMRMSSRRRWE